MKSTRLTARELYVRILATVSAKSAALPPQERDPIFCGELIEEGYLLGAVVKDSNGSIIGASVTGITVKGRLFLQTLRKEETERSLTGRAKRLSIFIFGVLAGVVAALLVEFVKYYLARLEY